MSAPLCPRCQIEMLPVEGTQGAWRCPHFAAHEFMEEQELRTDQAVPQPRRATGQSAPAAGRSHGEYWLSGIGLSGPLPEIPQSNIRDGSLLVAASGPGKRGGGGSKSGRRRKKPKKWPQSPGWLQ